MFDDTTLSTLESLLDAFEEGHLGPKIHERYPPGFPDEAARRRYFTLVPALNFQRRSEQLWSAALATYDDPDTRFVFESSTALADADATRSALVEHSLATQPNRHTNMWLGLCRTLARLYDGDPGNFCAAHDFEVRRIIGHISRNRKSFPSLGGPKMGNYWLFILDRFTDVRFRDREAISIIPDIHVRRATVKLGLATEEEATSVTTVAAIWQAGLTGTGMVPIDLHAPLWSWSRRGFPSLVGASTGIGRTDHGINEVVHQGGPK